MAKSLYKNAFFKGFLSFSNIAIPLLVIPYVYRVIDPNIIGQIEYGNTVYVYFFLLGSFGIYNYGLREISKVRDKIEAVSNIYHNLFSLSIVANLFSFIFLILFIVGYGDGNLKSILFVFSFGLIANILYTEWIIEAYEDYLFITIKTLIVRLIGIVLIFLFVNDSNDFLLYVIITNLTLFFNNVFSFIYSLRYTNYKFSFKGIEWKKYLPSLFFIFILNNSNALYTTIDKVMLGYYTSNENLAYYSLGQKIMEIIRTLLLTVIFVSIPRLSYYLEADYARYISGLKNLATLVLFITIPSSFGLFLISKEVVLVFAGEQYIDAILPTQIFALRIIILSLESIIAQQILFIHSKEKIILLFNVIFGLMHIFVNYMFINNLTPALTIFVTSFAEVLLIICELIYVNNKLDIKLNLFNKSIAIYLLGSITFIPIVYIVRSYIDNYLSIIFISSFLCLIFYTLTMIITKENFFKQLISNFFKL